MCPDMFTFRSAHVTGLDSATRPRNCEGKIVLHATSCHWAVLLGLPQPLRMQAPHSFETSATLTQRDVTQSQSVVVRGSTFSRSSQFIFFYQPRTVFGQSPQTVT
jgi:hypothetical protein